MNSGADDSSSFPTRSPLRELVHCWQVFWMLPNMLQAFLDAPAKEMSCRSARNWSN